MPKISIDNIFPNPDQPRKNFEPAALKELSDSIKENGLVEPIVITPRNGGYMIIAGERRWRACGMAGLKNPPVRVIAADDKKAAELALLENLQRQDLNPIEEAAAFRDLMEKHGLTEAELARKMGMKQTWRIRDRTDLLRMHPKYQKMLIEKLITPTQAWEISRLPHEKQHILYEKIRDGKADTPVKLRALANNLLVPPPVQTLFGGELSEKERSIGKKYDDMVDRLLSFLHRSFNTEDLKVLKKVTRSTVATNIQKLDLIMADLKRIKQAMEEAEGRKESIAA